MRAGTVRRVFSVVLAALLVLLAGAADALALPRNVNTTVDAANGVCSTAPGGCTLRDAIEGASSGDVVNVPAGTYLLAPALGELTVDTALSIVGASARTTIVSGQNQSRVLAVTGGNATVSGVTLTAGNAASASPSGQGGAVFVGGGVQLTMTNSAVTASTTGAAPNQGGGIYTDGTVELVGSTVGGNSTSNAGGGIFSSSDFGILKMTASTVSGNAATATGGGVYSADAALTVLRSTIAANTARGASGVFWPAATDIPDFNDTIIAGSGSPACGAGSIPSGTYNLSTDASCSFTGIGDKQSTNPLLGPLANNGGPTNTQALSPSSPAIGAANPALTSCHETDQRGVARPQGTGCDIGAYEYRAPTLTVKKVVVNDQGGTKTPASFSVHVKAAGADIAGSPKPGTSTGRTYVVAPGTYVVSEDTIKSYTSAIFGSCAADGKVTLAEGQAKTCTITNSDKPPVLGKLLNIEPEKGTIRVKLPGKKKTWRKLTGGEQLPLGTRVDTRKGRIGMFAAANKSGKVAQADFYDGIFKIGQTKGKRPITVLTLVQKLTGCKAKAAGNASVAKKKKKAKRRRLWGNGKGRFRTKGKRSAATVVGTKWLVEDRCTSTLTKVARGNVKVRDYVKHKTVLVKKGHRYIARAKR